MWMRTASGRRVVGAWRESDAYACIQLAILSAFLGYPGWEWGSSAMAAAGLVTFSRAWAGTTQAR